MERINFQACELFLMHGFHPCSFNFYHSSLSLFLFLPRPLCSNRYTCTCMHVEGQKSISFIDILLNHSLPYFLIWVSHWAWSSLVKLLWVVSKPWGDPPFCVCSEQGLQVRFFFSWMLKGPNLVLNDLVILSIIIHLYSEKQYKKHKTTVTEGDDLDSCD